MAKLNPFRNVARSRFDPKAAKELEETYVPLSATRIAECAARDAKSRGMDKIDTRAVQTCGKAAIAGTRRA